MSNQAHIPVATAQEVADHFKLNGVLILGLTADGGTCCATWGREPADKHNLAGVNDRVGELIMSGLSKARLVEDFRAAHGVNEAALEKDKLRRDIIKLRAALFQMLEVFDSDTAREWMDWTMLEIAACSDGRKAMTDTGGKPVTATPYKPVAVSLEELGWEAMQAHPLWDAFVKAVNKHQSLNDGKEPEPVNGRVKDLFQLFLTGNSWNNTKGLDAVVEAENMLSYPERLERVRELVRIMDRDDHNDEIAASDVLDPIEITSCLLGLPAADRWEALKTVLDGRSKDRPAGSAEPLGDLSQLEAP